jgi:hypothetical protein
VVSLATISGLIPRMWVIACSALVAESPASTACRTGEAMGIKLQGVGGGGTGEPIELQGLAGSHTRPPRKAAGGKAPQDRRRLTFFWGGAEIRRSRLRPLKSVLDVLRVPAARPGARHFRAEHVASRKGEVGGKSGGPPGLSKALQASRPFKTPPGF